MCPLICCSRANPWAYWECRELRLRIGNCRDRHDLTYATDEHQQPTKVFGVRECSPNRQGLTSHNCLSAKAFRCVDKWLYRTAPVTAGLLPVFWAAFQRQ